MLFIIYVRYYGSGLAIPANVEGCRILDVGCGSGSLVYVLSKLVGPKGYVIGVDITPKLVSTHTHTHTHTHWEREREREREAYKTDNRISSVRHDNFDIWLLLLRRSYVL